MQLSVERNVGPEMNDFFVLLLFIMHVYLPRGSKRVIGGISRYGHNGVA